MSSIRLETVSFKNISRSFRSTTCAKNSTTSDALYNTRSCTEGERAFRDTANFMAFSMRPGVLFSRAILNEILLQRVNQTTRNFQETIQLRIQLQNTYPGRYFVSFNSIRIRHTSQVTRHTSHLVPNTMNGVNIDCIIISTTNIVRKISFVYSQPFPSILWSLRGNRNYVPTKLFFVQSGCTFIEN